MTNYIHLVEEFLTALPIAFSFALLLNISVAYFVCCYPIQTLPVDVVSVIFQNIKLHFIRVAVISD